ncbi:MAG: hypothetical protein JXR25_03065 [Pontiellaceae bacterium]|nr:hypothetical protein [Pontiellaceae bacterium]
MNLVNQGLSSTNIQVAVGKALQANGQTQKGQKDAVQNALDDQGLSGSNIGSHVGNRVGQELDERGLSSAGIADALGDEFKDLGFTNEVQDISEEVDSSLDSHGLSATNLASEIAKSLAPEEVTTNSIAEDWNVVQSAFDDWYTEAVDKAQATFDPVKEILEGLKGMFHGVTWPKEYSINTSFFVIDLEMYKSPVDGFRFFVLCIIQLRACQLAIRLIQRIINGAMV